VLFTGRTGRDLLVELTKLINGALVTIFVFVLIPLIFIGPSFITTQALYCFGTWKDGTVSTVWVAVYHMMESGSGF
jgi:hypothetical protein